MGTITLHDMRGQFSTYKLGEKSPAEDWPLERIKRAAACINNACEIFGLKAAQNEVDALMGMSEETFRLLKAEKKTIADYVTETQNRKELMQ